MILEIFRVLCPGSRFVMINICSRKMLGWVFYRYFPTTPKVNLQDFMPKEQIRDRLTQAGFDNVKIELNPQEYGENLLHFAESVLVNNILK